MVLVVHPRDALGCRADRQRGYTKFNFTSFQIIRNDLTIELAGQKKKPRQYVVFSEFCTRTLLLGCCLPWLHPVSYDPVNPDLGPWVDPFGKQVSPLLSLHLQKWSHLCIVVPDTIPLGGLL
ncbi:hypothetical protein AVEN_242703-1 [Araneus ventricosus]|uniref:Uncharacterized protein n=1 Tax=Araneus ventricosus TaxID=182803 RepID=A0A4Y2E2E5_ARAVE|nr:hypothetical protein AVEN_242703-1 [Araneus ventricosus]